MTRSTPSLLLLALALPLVACGDKEPEDDTGGPEDFDGDGYTADVDCNDDDDTIHPDATEVCDGADNDCDELVDDDDNSLDTTTASTFYADADGDGYGDDEGATLACSAPSGAVEVGGDCDDVDPRVNPDAQEVCDDADVDEDCDGLSDDADDTVDSTTQTATWPDTDGDGYGDAAGSPTDYCDPPSGVVADDADCDDTNADIHPGATEVCDDGDVDEDCSGAADDADPGVDTGTQTLAYLDADGDGYGDVDDTGTLYCDLPSGYAADGSDCDDADIDVNPGATEECDGVDNDCDGTLDASTCLACGDLSILTYYDSFTSSAVPANLAAMGFRASATATSSSSTFASQYDGGTWDIVIVDVPGSGTPSSVSSRVGTQISSGGIVLYSDFNLNNDTAMQATLGVTVDESISTPLPLHSTTGTTLWSLEETLPDPVTNNSHDAGDNGDVISPVDTATSEQLAHYDGDTTKGAILATYSGQVIVNGFLPWDFQDTDDDADSTSDMVELYTNEIIWTTGCLP